MLIRISGFVAFALIIFNSTIVSAISPKDDQRKIDLVPGTATNFKIESRMEIKGSLFLDPSEKTRAVSMDVKASYRYGERLATKNDLIKAIRYYDQAESNIKLATGSTKASLDNNNRYLIIERKTNPVGDKRIRFQSPQPTLTESELNLVNVPCSTMLLTKWLSKKSATIDEAWTTDNDVLADILTWDYIEENEVAVKISEANSQTAQLKINGSARGVVDGAASEVTIQGTCIYNLVNGFVSNASFRIVENRDAGLVAPGFEANMWVESNISTAKQTRLTNAALGQLKMSPYSRADQLSLNAKCGPYQLQHPRHWRVISNRDSRTVLRCIRDGVVLAQCDIVPLPNQPAGAAVTLGQFQANVQKALTNGNGRVVGSQQSPTISQQKWMRVDAVGDSNEIEMRWIYCTVTSPDLRRVQLLFTLEEAVNTEFAGLEKDLLDAIEFTTPAKTTEKDGRSASKNSSRR